MKVLHTEQTRQEYVETQIARFDSKFHFCKVSIYDVAKHQTIISRDMIIRGKQLDIGPILCLGTRNGREVDLFRLQFFGSRLLRYASKVFERESHSFISRLPRLESIGRSEVGNISRESVVAVEINPRAARSDICIGSFDEMPSSWAHKFSVVFSNSFDHSQDPHQTAEEWRRVTRPGGYLILCFAEGVEPTITDPVSDLHLADILDLFGGELVYFDDRGSRCGYSEVIVRLDNV